MAVINPVHIFSWRIVTFPMASLEKCFHSHAPISPKQRLDINYYGKHNSPLDTYQAIFFFPNDCFVGQLSSPFWSWTTSKEEVKRVFWCEKVSKPHIHWQIKRSSDVTGDLDFPCSADSVWSQPQLHWSWGPHSWWLTHVQGRGRSPCLPWIMTLDPAMDWMPIPGLLDLPSWSWDLQGKEDSLDLEPTIQFCSLEPVSLENTHCCNIHRRESANCETPVKSE